MGMGRKKGTEKDINGLCEMDLWARFLYIEIFDHKRNRDKEIKSKVVFKGKEL